MDINTAPIEHLRLLPIPSDAISEIIQFRTQRPIRTTKDFSGIFGVGPKIMEKILVHIKPLMDQAVDPLDGGSAYTHSEMPTPTPSESSALDYYGIKRRGPHMTMPIGWICCEQDDGDSCVLITMKGKIQPGDLWADSGCVRGVGGEDQHEIWSDHLTRHFNLKPVVMPCNEQFQFGDGHVEKSSKKYLYPSFFQGKFEEYSIKHQYL